MWDPKHESRNWRIRYNEIHVLLKEPCSQIQKATIDRICPTYGEETNTT